MADRGGRRVLSGRAGSGRPLLRRTALAAAAAVTTALAGGTGAAIAASPSSGPAPVTFTVGITQDVDSLNPFIGVLASSYEIYQDVYDTLTGYSSRNFGIVPGLATSWHVSDHGLVWTYRIRSGVRWSDGVPLTAHDCAYTFNRIIHGSFEQTNYGNYVANIVSATAPNNTTLVMRTKVPTPIMLKLLVSILPEHIWQHIGEKAVQTYPNTAPVGSGPFILESRQVGQYIKLRANKHWWGGAPHIDQLVYRVFGNEDAEVQALRKGEIDFADSLSGTLYGSLAHAVGITRVPAIYSGFDEIGMNTGAATVTGAPIGNGNPALRDKRVRVAIAHAIDKATLVSKVLRGYGQPATTIMPPIYAAWHYQPPPGEQYTFDLAAANRLLDAAGYPRGAGGIRHKGRVALNFRLFARSDSVSSQQTVQFVQGWLRQIGIATTVSVVAENRLTQLIGDGDYDLFEWGWVVEPDPDYQLSTFTCAQRSTRSGGTITAGLSDSFYCNPAYDALYREQGNILDLARREQVVRTAEKLLYDDAPYVLTYYYDDLEAYRSDRWTGLVPQPYPDGAMVFQYGTYTYDSVRPISKALGSTGGSSTGTVVGVAVAAVVVLGGGTLWALRRRATAGERE